MASLVPGDQATGLSCASGGMLRTGAPPGSNGQDVHLGAGGPTGEFA